MDRVDQLSCHIEELENKTLSHQTTIDQLNVALTRSLDEQRSAANKVRIP